MAISIDKQFGVHQHALQLRSQRASVLANNIANADTPGFKARDLDFQAMLKNRMGEPSDQLNLQASHSQHSTTVLQADTINGLKFRNPTQPSIDGNTVDSQKEKTEFAANSLQYQAAFEFLNGKVKSLISAIRGE